MDKIKSLLTFFLVLMSISHSSFAASMLKQKVLVVSQNAFVVSGNRIGVNIASPAQFLDVRNTGGTSLISVTSTGLGIGTTTPADTVEVVGTMNLRDGALYYQSSDITPTADWRLYYRDDCSTYTNGTYNGWANYLNNDTPYTTVSSGYGSGKFLGPVTWVAGADNHVYKDYPITPTHTRVRVVIQYYCIDTWSSHYAFMKLSSQSWVAGPCMMLWEQTRSNNSYLNINYGGSSTSDTILRGMVEGYNNATMLKVTVGSNASASSTGTFGIGSVEIWIR